MATADSVKDKIEGLIDIANAATGKKETTLGAAVLDLVASYGGVTDLNAGTRMYGAASDASISAGDFVELIPSWGIGSVTDAEIGALAVAQLSDSKAVVLYDTEGTGPLGGSLAEVRAALLSADGPSVTVTLATMSGSGPLDNRNVAVTALSDTMALAVYTTYSNYMEVWWLVVDGETLNVYKPLPNFFGHDPSLTALTENKALLAFRDANNQGQAVVLTVGGTGVAKGTNCFFDSNIKKPKVVTLDASTVLIAYEAYDSTSGRAVVMTVSGTTATRGGVYTFRSANTSDLALTPMDPRRALLVYRDSGSTGYLTATVLQVSGTSVTTQNSPSLTFTKYGGTKPAVARVSEQAVLVLANILTQSSGYKTQAQLLTIGGSSITKAAEIDLVGPANQDGLHALAVKSDGVALALSGTAGSGSMKHTYWQGLEIGGSTVSQQTMRGTRVVPLTSEKYPVGVVKSVVDGVAFTYRAGAPTSNDD